MPITGFASFMTSFSAQATTVLIRIAPIEIVVAADSKRRDLGVGDYGLLTIRECAHIFS